MAVVRSESIREKQEGKVLPLSVLQVAAVLGGIWKPNSSAPPSSGRACVHA